MTFMQQDNSIASLPLSTQDRSYMFKKIKSLSVKGKLNSNLTTMKFLFPKLKAVIEYKDTKELMKGRSIFLRLFEYIMKQIQAGDIPFTHRTIYFKAIPFLLLRPELGPNNYLERTENGFVGAKSELKLFRKFRQLLLDAQIFAIDCLQGNIPNDELITYLWITVYNCINWNHLHDFVMRFLEMNFKPSMDVKRIVKSMKKDSKTLPKNRSEIIFDIRDKFDFLDRNIVLEEAIPNINSNWLNKIYPGSSGYFKFLNSWCYIIDSLGKIKYDSIPGYYVMIMPFLQELQDCDFQEYSANLLNTSFMFLSNEVIIEQYIRVVLAKTNLYDHARVSAMFDLLEQWAGKMVEREKEGSFHYDSLFRTFSVIIEYDHYVPISRLLIFIHNYLELFPRKGQIKLIRDVIFKNYFHHLFLHWCTPVRNLFHRLIVYRFLEGDILDIEKTTSENKMENIVLSNLKSILDRVDVPISKQVY
eukprot:TRINITY_DN2856_c0_g1_i1.p1 TRINITY_DN2856_c0_g1~~TRINITY_DN2856_c0_g1_i1.p1  ORF type:complete len:473 (+),score=56.82 TRINITY_DN2856_c0_g1_i1:30-1448(+)